MIKMDFGVGDDGKKIEYTFKDIHNLLITGCCGCGKTNYLKHIIKSIIANFTEKDVNFAFVEYVTELKDLVDDKFLLKGKNVLADNEEKALLVLKDIIKIIESRYALFVEEKVENYIEYSKKNQMPEIILFYDLNSLPYNNKDFIESMQKILRFGNGAGVHIILSLQNIVHDSEMITDYLPSRLCGKVFDENVSAKLLETNKAFNLSDYWFILRGATWNGITKCKIDSNVQKMGL